MFSNQPKLKEKFFPSPACRIPSCQNGRTLSDVKIREPALFALARKDSRERCQDDTPKDDQSRLIHVTCRKMELVARDEI